MGAKPVDTAEATPSTTSQRRETSKSAQPQQPKSRQSRFSLALLVLFGTVFGSVIGVAADAASLVDAFNAVRSNFYAELCVGGSGTIMEPDIGLSPAIHEAVSFPVNAMRLTVHTDGSRAALERAKNDGCIHVILATDALKDGEIRDLANEAVSIDCAAVFAYDVIAIVANRSVRAGSASSTLNTRELRAILSGAITNWSQVRGDDMPITIVAQFGRTMQYIMREIAGFESTYERPCPDGVNCFMAEGGNEVPLSELLNTSGSITWMSAAWMRLQPPNFFNVVSVLDTLNDERSVNPLTDAVDLEMYPRDLVRPLYIYAVVTPNTSQEQRVRARQFVRDIMRGVVGQQLVVKHGFYPHFEAPRDVDVTLPPGFSDTNRCRAWGEEADLLKQYGPLKAILPSEPLNS
ncbi:MAG: substrate-binding domain-containing protein [Anaerolineae bacterium]|nr:substrate-binding domain-containing protein [Anaerolineae bacterium]MDW8173437.1 substrate-binding domain-containing protein [Anaerolineae bacterium]